MEEFISLFKSDPNYFVKGLQPAPDSNTTNVLFSGLIMVYGLLLYIIISPLIIIIIIIVDTIIIIIIIITTTTILNMSFVIIKLISVLYLYVHLFLCV